MIVPEDPRPLHFVHNTDDEGLEKPEQVSKNTSDSAFSTDNADLSGDAAARWQRSHPIARKRTQSRRSPLVLTARWPAHGLTVRFGHLGASRRMWVSAGCRQLWRGISFPSAPALAGAPMGQRPRPVLENFYLFALRTSRYECTCPCSPSLACPGCACAHAAYVTVRRSTRPRPQPSSALPSSPPPSSAPPSSAPRLPHRRRPYCRRRRATTHHQGTADFRIGRAVRGISKGACMLHTCHTPACVARYHIIEGTQQQNMQQRAEKPRSHTPQPMVPMARRSPRLSVSAPMRSPRTSAACGARRTSHEAGMEPRDSVLPARCGTP